MMFEGFFFSVLNAFFGFENSGTVIFSAELFEFVRCPLLWYNGYAPIVFLFVVFSPKKASNPVEIISQTVSYSKITTPRFLTWQVLHSLISVSLSNLLMV